MLGATAIFWRMDGAEKWSPQIFKASEKKARGAAEISRKNVHTQLTLNETWWPKKPCEKCSIHKWLHASAGKMQLSFFKIYVRAFPIWY